MAARLRFAPFRVAVGIFASFGMDRAAVSGPPVQSSQSREGPSRVMNMVIQKQTALGIPSAALGALMGIVLLALVGCATTKEAAPPEPENKETVIEPPPKPFVSMVADQTTRLINLRGQETDQSVHIYRDGYKVRTETINTTPPELYIFDHSEKVEYQLHEADKIYFQINLPLQAQIRAQREGLIPWEKDPRAETTREVLGKATIDGHPCEIIFTVRKFDFKEQKMIGYEYTLSWEALDLERQPIRVAYAQSKQVLAVVDYSNIKTDPIDPALFKVPDDYLSFTPY
jgi:hypothetical protein